MALEIDVTQNPAPASGPRPCAEPPSTGATPAAPKAPRPVPPAAERTLTWDGPEGTLEYRCRAGHLPIVDDDGTPMAQMFYRAYLVDDAGAGGDWRRPARPVVFCYNGGPGCASVPLDFGGIGPVRVATDGTRHMKTPARLESNPACPIALADMVFLDAPGTGWSFTDPAYDASKLFGVDGDADAFSRAIQRWLTENKRWNSPILLFGESYGTVRNAVLARKLGEDGVGVSGVVQLSTIYDWAATLPGNDLYYLGMTPTYAAVAQWFGKTGADVEPNQWFDEACAFVNETLAGALVMGDRLGEEREREVAEEMAGFVGLSPERLLRSHLRVELEDFRRELLAEEGRTLGRLDLRYTAASLPPVQGATEFVAGEDAADDAYEAVWTGAFRAVMDAIGYTCAEPYVSTNWKVNEGWKWAHKAPGTLMDAPAPNVALDMAQAMRRNPRMRVCYLGGRYDTATCYWNVIHDVSDLFLPEALKAQQEFHLYGSGHMAYTDEESLSAMARDVREFVARCVEA